MAGEGQLLRAQLPPLQNRDPESYSEILRLLELRVSVAFLADMTKCLTEGT